MNPHLLINVFMRSFDAYSLSASVHESPAGVEMNERAKTVKKNKEFCGSYLKYTSAATLMSQVFASLSHYRLEITTRHNKDVFARHSKQAADRSA